ncbi:unnamed protein product [Spirodela intermedia]|uniref:Uncharacterized protein n=1 Tax=Spirodela intermedia TaxID=51605 RepID=A0A7I8IQF9_SPIIN|nr:unnamed protein product [Spirodela intermedia]CAA6659764.1 unnamed protein product [Spirodela intermedia]
MAGEACVERPLFGGSISSTLPLRFQDVSNVRDVPDHQEAFVDPSRDESVIFELLDLKDEVGDEGSAGWFLRDLAAEQDAEGSMILEHTSAVGPSPLSHGGISSTITTAVGQMVISKDRQGREAGNLLRVYLANLRLKGVGTDVLITVYEPIMINPLSESAMTVSTGPAIPAAQSGLLPASEIFRLAVTGFKVNDWNLFGTTGA